MSRADTVKKILVLEQFAAEAKHLAGLHRAALDADARAEYTEQGAAPTWRMPDIATITLPISKQAIEVSDPAALMAWVQHNHPGEIETTTTTRVRPSFLTALLGRVISDEGLPVYKDTGEVLPGLTVQQAGRPRALSIKAEPGVKAIVGAAVAEMLGTAHAAIAAPPEARPVIDDPWAAVGDPFALFPAATAGGAA